MEGLSERQQRERDYHKTHAGRVADRFKSIDYEVVTSPNRRWWNAYWEVWTYLRSMPLTGSKVLVVGCGWGSDALRFAKLGAQVSAFDLSPDMLVIAKRFAEADGLAVQFEEMPAEKMTYDTGVFDIVFCRDILHHVDIPKTMNEISRVTKLGGVLVIDEIYSHSLTDVVRHSWLVERVLYPAMRPFIYQEKINYITEDERKMTERDIAIVRSYVDKPLYCKYFNFFVTRIVPDKFVALSKLDRTFLRILGSAGKYLAGRIVFAGHVRNNH
jgi:ubiquinone/menaquinone biosynthesis C-methylase UbiE